MLKPTRILLFASFALAQGGELHQASRVCDAGRIRQLLSQGRPVNETDETGMTPLHVAIDSRQKACVGLLLAAGADRMLRDNQGRTAVDAAQRVEEARDRAEILLLISGSGQNALREQKGPMPWTLESSVTKRNPEVTKMLLALGANPNTTGATGATLLAEAALRGDLETVRALLAKGARTNAVSPAGTQAIHDAALGDSAEVIRELVMQGAEVNARSRNEIQTPLHVAAAMGKMKAVDALVALGADLTAKDSNGRTPLDAAERAGLAGVAALLKAAAAAAK